MSRLAVWEAPPRLSPGDPDWERLRGELRRLAPDILLMNELPFGPWIAAAPEPDPDALAASRRAHGEGLDRLDELEVPVVLGTRPIRASSAFEPLPCPSATGLFGSDA